MTYTEYRLIKEIKNSLNTLIRQCLKTMLVRIKRFKLKCVCIRQSHIIIRCDTLSSAKKLLHWCNNGVQSGIALASVSTHCSVATLRGIKSSKFHSLMEPENQYTQWNKQQSRKFVQKIPLKFFKFRMTKDSLCD